MPDYVMDVQMVEKFEGKCREAGCSWRGPARSTRDDACDDLADHWQEHDRRWAAYNVALERGANNHDSMEVLAGRAQPPLRVGDRARNADGDDGTLVWNDGVLWGLDFGEPWGVHEYLHGVDEWGPGLTWLPPEESS